MILNLYQAFLNTGKGKKNKEGSKNHIYSAFNGNSKTIKDFYDGFVFDRLPDLDIVLRWHNMLEEYCGRPGAIYPIRTGNVSKKLRRGWLTKTDQDFSYFYTDNDLALYIYKMALDGYCPSTDEFYDCMTSFVKVADIKWITSKKNIYNVVDKKHNVERKFINFPVHFLRSGGKTYPDKYENEMNALIINGPCCCLGRSSYKHSHIFEAGKNYLINGKLMGIDSICDSYFNLGDVDDYKWDSNISNYVRNVSVSSNDVKKYKKILKAITLRFIDPLNHFLSPKAGCNKFTMSGGEESCDIAEYDPLLDYIKCERKRAVIALAKKDIFSEFEKDVLSVPYLPNNGTEQINISYNANMKTKKNANVRQPSTNGSNGAVLYRNKYYSKRLFVINALKDFIVERKITSLAEFETYFPKIARLEATIKDKTRYSETIVLPSGEAICISNQIGDKPTFPVQRNYSSIKEKLIKYNFEL